MTTSFMKENVWQSIDIPPKTKGLILVLWGSGVVERAQYSDDDYWFIPARGDHLVNKMGFIGWRYQTPSEALN